MIIRPMREDDVPKLKALHSSSKAKYDIPELNNLAMITAYVVVDDDDEPRALLAARRTVEMYLVIDHEWESPAYRFHALKTLVEAARIHLTLEGYDDAYCFIGPDVPKSYIRRLMDMGARKMVWTALHFLRGEV